MRVFISVVSHLHHDVIINLETLKNISVIDDVVVICRDNIPVKFLEDYCHRKNIIYIPNIAPKGFAENNNLNYCYYRENFSFRSNDLFYVLNPDIILDGEALTHLKKVFISAAAHDDQNEVVVTGNLFLEREHLIQDDNLRRYPHFFDFIKTYLFNDRSKFIDRNLPIPTDDNLWASGACLLMKSSTYEKLQGLDERFYLYCEDIDFCKRALRLGIKVRYVAEAKLVHYRRRNSKGLFTQYFFWHVASVLKYTLFPSKIQPKKSCLKVKPSAPSDKP